jgi:FkbM family methyltransferase
MESTYRSDFPYTDSNFLKHITKPIKTIVELGCNDYQYTYDLLREYDPDILYAFEANPNCIQYCLSNTTDSRIKLIPKAVAEHDGMIDFYGFGEMTGCSSLFKRIHLPQYQDPKIQVPCTRLDTFFANSSDIKIDLLCMDIQGAELMAIRSLGKLIDSVCYLMLEIPKEGKFMHHGAPTRTEMMNFFTHHNFKVLELMRENDWEDNILLKKIH